MDGVCLAGRVRVDTNLKVSIEECVTKVSHKVINFVWATHDKVR